MPTDGTATLELLEARMASRRQYDSDQENKRKEQAVRRKRAAGFFGTVALISAVVALGSNFVNRKAASDKQVAAKEFFVYGDESAWEIAHDAYPTGNANELGFKLLDKLPRAERGTGMVPAGDIIILPGNSEIGNKTKIPKKEAGQLPVIESTSLSP